jgi:hypothetical protein
MIETAIPLTLHLAVLIGLYELAAGLVSLSGRMDWTAMLDEFERSPGLTFVTGFMAFAIGGAIVLGHNHWTDPLAVIVSLIGWIAAAEGLLIMVMGRSLMLLSRPLVRYPKAIGIAASLFGLALILAGLTGRATALTYI